MGQKLSPLNRIIGASRIVNGTSDQNERQKFNAVMLRSGETLLELTKNVMDISSLDSGKVVLESRPIQLAGFIELTLSPFVFQTYSKNIEIRHEIVAGFPKIILGNAARLPQIIINLTANAIKFTHNGYASLILDSDHNHLRSRVLDTGIGIPTALQGKLFVPCVHDVDTTRKYGGSELGFAIAKPFRYEELDTVISINLKGNRQAAR
ncbi:MAG: signal transduction histidine kinase [Glaciecola sp.]|jgi:signal transduction histidine kinase